SGTPGCGGNVNLTNGTFDWVGSWGSGYTMDNYSITSLGNGWYKILLFCTASTATTYSNLGVRPYKLSVGSITYNGDGSSGVYVYGVNVVYGSVDKGFTPTTTTARYSSLAKGGGNGSTSAAGAHATGGQGDVIYEGGDGYKPASGNAVGGGG